MKLLKKRSIAILIVAIVVIAATLVGVYSSAHRVSREAERLFFDGLVLEDGRPQASISRGLHNSADAALSLATLMRSYPELENSANMLLSTQQELMSAGSISEKASAATVMREAFFALETAAEQVNLSERDEEALMQFSASFSGAMTAIGNAQYNAFAEARLSEQNALLRQMSRFLGARTPELFYMS
ncbi:MAG: hypothetical protein FWC75_02590 [Oscillospiraceae bacterium]|nr:hypothetical protein [Oscillospiraceae bacterium]